MNFKQNKSYLYSNIEQYCIDNDLHLECATIGNGGCGKDFVYFENDSNVEFTFIMDGFSKESTWKCIYVE